MADNVTARPLILLVEDEIALAATMVTTLEGEYEIDAAASVEEARMLLGTRTYALILCDHMLPGKDQGLDFLVEALERQPAAKRILMTGYLNPELLARSVPLAKLSACLVKPVPIARLKQEIQSALTGGAV